MKRINIESPFKPDAKKLDPRYSEAEHLRQNLVYARMCMLDALKRGEAPYLSHLLYTQAWNESPEERAAGIKAGLEYARVADGVVFYGDLGMSEGMNKAREFARENLIPCSVRTLFASSVDVRAVLNETTAPAFPFLAALQAKE